MNRKPIVAVIGSNNVSNYPDIYELSLELGKCLIDAGFRIINGGKGGVMEAVFKGAKNSQKYNEGLTIGIIPETTKQSANEFADIVIATGMTFARNQIIVASADIVIAIHGGAGTLSEIAMAWQFDKPIISIITNRDGWSDKLAGKRIDFRARDKIFKATSPIEATEIAKKIVNNL